MAESISCIRFVLVDRMILTSGKINKKADAAKHPKVRNHVGLLFNEPPGAAGLPFIKSSENLNRGRGKMYGNPAYYYHYTTSALR